MICNLVKQKRSEVTTPSMVKPISLPEVEVVENPIDINDEPYIIYKDFKHLYQEGPDYTTLEYSLNSEDISFASQIQIQGKTL